jgi:peroxiredoxin (alkyl hydroperoxide reductase subunit C)
MESLKVELPSPNLRLPPHSRTPALTTCPEVSLRNYENRWLVLAFIPMAWTFVCPTEIIAFSDAAPQFASRGTSVVFASTDSEYSLLAWASTPRKSGGLGGVNIPLLSDKNHSLSRDYGVLIEEEGIALRGLFLIDPRGLVRQVSEFAGRRRTCTSWLFQS